MPQKEHKYEVVDFERLRVPEPINNAEGKIAAVISLGFDEIRKPENRYLCAGQILNDNGYVENTSSPDESRKNPEKGLPIITTFIDGKEIREVRFMNEFGYQYLTIEYPDQLNNASPRMIARCLTIGRDNSFTIESYENQVKASFSYLIGDAQITYNLLNYDGTLVLTEVSIIRDVRKQKQAAVVLNTESARQWLGNILPVGIQLGAIINLFFNSFLTLPVYNKDAREKARSYLFSVPNLTSFVQYLKR